MSFEQSEKSARVLLKPSRKSLSFQYMVAEIGVPRLSSKRAKGSDIGGLRMDFKAELAKAKAKPRPRHKKAPAASALSLKSVEAATASSEGDALADAPPEGEFDQDESKDSMTQARQSKSAITLGALKSLKPKVTPSVISCCSC